MGDPGLWPAGETGGRMCGGPPGRRIAGPVRCNPSAPRGPISRPGLTSSSSGSCGRGNGGGVRCEGLSLIGHLAGGPGGTSAAGSYTPFMSDRGAHAIAFSRLRCGQAACKFGNGVDIEGLTCGNPMCNRTLTGEQVPPA